ncbi:MAG: acetylxylan esterase, partial [Acidobacteria bacterium]|nr:acetylxylan esterase [Acidobacteriota bacterium]
MFRASFPLAAALALLPLSAQQATVPPSEMLRSWLTGIAGKQLSARREAVSAIQTPEQLNKRQAESRTKLLAMIGGLPEPAPSLALRRTGSLDRDGYRVEKVIFEGQPGMFITANLYVPKTGKPPYPAVLHSVGHSPSAKNRAFYQTISIGLVQHGFVVLTYDPSGQGERRIFWDRELEDSKAGGPTIEHEMVGLQSLLAGESIARQFIRDGMRGIDLLTSLPEVDPKRIGITGCSGGGTLTAYLAVIDPRVAAAAPACYISSWEEQLQNGTGPQDAEQQFPDLLR